jgi:hypothetical protein
MKIIRLPEERKNRWTYNDDCVFCDIGVTLYENDIKIVKNTGRWTCPLCKSFNHIDCDPIKFSRSVINKIKNSRKNKMFLIKNNTLMEIKC